MRVLRLKVALQTRTRDQVFVEYNKFLFIVDILNNNQFWKTLFALIQACYPIYRILRISDTMIGGMDKLYYYVRQADRLLEPQMEKVMKHFHEPSMPNMGLSQLKLSKADNE